MRVDVLLKTGNTVELIEVEGQVLRAWPEGRPSGPKGAIRWAICLTCRMWRSSVSWLGVAASALRLPDLSLLADKSSIATVDGLNQLFPLLREGGRVRVSRPADGVDLGAPLLAAVPVDAEVAEILCGTLNVSGADMPFRMRPRTWPPRTELTGSGLGPCPALPAASVSLGSQPARHRRATQRIP